MLLVMEMNDVVVEQHCFAWKGDAERPSASCFAFKGTDPTNLVTSSSSFPPHSTLMSRPPNNHSFAPTCPVKKSAKEKLTRAPGTKIDILTSISGYVQSGHVLAIIGPSGAGKTTLLDALAVRMPAEDPTSIRLNGEIMAKEIFRSHCSYMPQDDRYVCCEMERGRGSSRRSTLASPPTATPLPLGYGPRCRSARTYNLLPNCTCQDPPPRKNACRRWRV